MNNLNLIDEIIGGMPDGLSDLEKSYYIYIKTCQIFNYDTRYNDSPILISELIKKRYQNIKNIKDINIVCSVWSKIYIDLLKKVAIDAKLVNRNGHSWVECYVDGMIIYSDPTYSKYTDLSRVKHNSSVHHYFPVTAEKTDKLPIRDSKANFDIEELNKKIGYLDNEEEFFNMLEEKISKFDRLNDQVKCIFDNAKFTFTDVAGDFEYIVNILRVLLKYDHKNITYAELVKVNDDYTFDNKKIITVFEDDVYNYYVLDSNLVKNSAEEVLNYANSGYGMKPIYREIGINYPLKFSYPKNSLKYFLNILKFNNKNVTLNNVKNR